MIQVGIGLAAIQRSDCASKTKISRGGWFHETFAATVLYVPGQSREQHRPLRNLCVAVLRDLCVAVYATNKRGVGGTDD